MTKIIEFETDRLHLRQWIEADKAPFARLNADARVMEFLSSGEGLQLSLAFMRIKDAKVRRRILDLVRSLANEDGEPNAK